MKIILTGGGSGGHFTPNLALMQGLAERGYEVVYIGGKNGIERELAQSCGIPYIGISAGKLRRYFDLKNFTDFFRFLRGIYEAFKAVRKIRPAAVFSKGGFVAVPVVIAARLSGVGVVIHESDMTLGLANRISVPFARKVCVSFKETLNRLPSKKGEYTGLPIRGELFGGSIEKAAAICGFGEAKPVILVTGGSSGARKINAAVRGALPLLLGGFNVAHLCGKGNLDAGLEGQAGYRQFEYLADEMPHIYAFADVVISRAGANTIFELVALKKPNLLIPLSRSASRGDQILNAGSFERRGFSMTLREEDMTPESLADSVRRLYGERESFINKMNGNDMTDGSRAVLDVIDGVAAR